MIGSLEVTLSHCFPSACLHWGWRRGDTYLDPLGLVSDTRVRLLPLWRDQPVDHGGSTEVPAGSVVPLPYAVWAPTLRDSLADPTTIDGSPLELLGVHVPVGDSSSAHGPTHCCGPAGRSAHDDIAIEQVRDEALQHLVVGPVESFGQP